MLKHVEQSVAAAALRWFREHREGLAAYYAPQMEVDPPFRVRFTSLHDNVDSVLLHVEGGPDPARWSDTVYLAAFLSVQCFKQALDAVGPGLLKQAHQRLQHGPFAKMAPAKKKKTPRGAADRRKADRRGSLERRRDFSTVRRTVHDAARAAKKRKVTRGR